MTKIRGTHHYSFRPGQWATLRGTVFINGRACYSVVFPDNKTDYWVVSDTVAGYEFKEN